MIERNMDKIFTVFTVSMYSATLVWRFECVFACVGRSSWSDWNPVAIRLPAFIDVHSGSYLSTRRSCHCWFGHRIINAERDGFPYRGHLWAGCIRLPVTALFQKTKSDLVRYECKTCDRVSFDSLWSSYRFIIGSITDIIKHFYCIGNHLSVSFNKLQLSCTFSPHTAVKD